MFLGMNGKIFHLKLLCATILCNLLPYKAVQGIIKAHKYTVHGIMGMNLKKTTLCLIKS